MDFRESDNPVKPELHPPFKRDNNDKNKSSAYNYLNPSKPESNIRKDNLTFSRVKLVFMAKTSFT